MPIARLKRLITSPGRDTSGERLPSELRRWLKARNLFAWSVLLGFATTALSGFAVVDFVRRAIATDERVQDATLKSELAQFLLATSQEDGSSILDNPADFAPALRTMHPVELRRSFFSYFLTSGNGKFVNAQAITWEMPRACAVDFVDSVSNSPLKSLRACFAVVPSDSSGRYVFFALRYATPEIVRHEPGLPVDRASSVVLALGGDVSAHLRLMFEQPRYARQRFPAQLKRFQGIHEVTAYAGERALSPLRSFQGQAFERRIEGSGGHSQNFVTIVGRIDAGVLFPTSDSQQKWTAGAFRRLSVHTQVFEVEPTSRLASAHITVPVDARGTALQSLEQAYLANVQSRALLTVAARNRAGSPLGVWTSASLQTKDKSEPGAFQRATNEWTRLLVQPFELKVADARAAMPVQALLGATATLAAEPVLLPDLAARAFFWLSSALLSVLILGVFWIKSLRQLRSITKEGLQSARLPVVGSDMTAYRKRHDEIGLLGRTFSVLIRRYRLRNAAILKNAAAATRLQNERAKLQEERVQARQDVLRAIGHGIKTPLQALMDRTEEGSVLREEIDKMSRAVDILYWATSVDAGVRGRSVKPRSGDVAHFLRRLCANLSSSEEPVVFEDPDHPVPARFDSFALDDVCNCILDNARRHTRPRGSVISVRLVVLEESVSIVVHNNGKHIPVAALPFVFNLGFTTQTTSEQNMGLGLFSARIYVLNMGGSIRIDNVPGGVEVTMTLPRTASSA